MRITFLLVIIASLGACQQKIASKRVEKLDFEGFFIEAPKGWSKVTDQRVLEKAAPGSHTLMMDRPPAGFTPSIYIQALPSEVSAMLKNATAEQCRDLIQKPLAAQTGTAPGQARTAAFGAFVGCDVEVISPGSRQATRQLSITNGRLSVSIVCNRDKGGAPRIDSVCEGIAKGITPK
ncbi:MAG: hypothetical protein RBU30_07305 [Polyangia bacterium]|jgi:hypothetical protein|nr:hypothetical protein [Polyangia bacterium]